MRVVASVFLVVSVPMTVLAVMRGDTASALIRSTCAAVQVAYLLSAK